MAVTIDDNFVRFNAKSYALNKINSVEVREIKLSADFIPALLAVFSSIGLFVGVVAVLTGAIGNGAVTLLVAAAILAFCIYKIRQAPAFEYQLYLTTSAGQTQAFTSYDKGEVYELRNGIEDAMVRR